MILPINTVQQHAREATPRFSDISRGSLERVQQVYARPHIYSGGQGVSVHDVCVVAACMCAMCVFIYLSLSSLSSLYHTHTLSSPSVFVSLTVQRVA
jgi:hypothetical protein